MAHHTCSTDDCSNPLHSNGYCVEHFQPLLDYYGNFRVCTACSEEKPLDSFERKKLHRLSSQCKPCIYAKGRERRNAPGQKARVKAWHDAHRDRVAEYQKKYYAAHRDQLKASMAANYQANKPARYAAGRKWARENRERHLALAREIQNRRRSRRLALPVEPYAIEDIIDRDGYDCVLCGETVDFEDAQRGRWSPSVEHLECISWPNSAGDVLSNVALAHLGCNSSRGNKPHPRAAAKRAALLAASAA